MNKMINFPIPHYYWPYIGEEQIKDIVDQLHTSLSIRDNSGIVGKFERKFADFIGTKYAISFCSGTSALHAMCVASGLHPEDEVLCPVYTFFATISPFVYEGIQPVFCDIDIESGNISIESMENKLTEKTKAVMVVHMWGIPCDMTKISAFCKRHSLLLFEDCSHAHFAKWQGENVGTFGDMAAFSLNQKAITTGEGGVLVTNNEEYKDKALLFGHYNLRCKKEITPSKEYYKYALTGMGLKHRLHPLGLALGVNQLKNVRQTEEKRRKNLDLLASSVNANSPLKPIIIQGPSNQHGLYLLAFKLDKKNCKYSLKEVIKKFHEVGAVEIDVPGATGLLHKEPLFNHRGTLRHDKLYQNHTIHSQLTYPNAQQFSVQSLSAHYGGTQVMMI